MIRAIETHYKGYRFRSRLEARWAVYFDALGMMWDYELEGYTLKSGERYLPDFYLRDWGVHVEIKGDEPSKAERRRCRELKEESNRAVLLLCGTPALAACGYIYAWDLCDSGGGSYEQHPVTIVAYRGKPHISVDEDTRVERDRNVYARWIEGSLPVVSAPELRRSDLSLWDRAVCAARSARFEHGSHGAAA